MDDCLICKITRGEVETVSLLDTETCFAFLENKPDCVGHVIIAPKKHIATILEADVSTMANLTAGIQTVMKRIQAVLAPEGFNVGWNQGPASGQLTPHLHMHIFPRWTGDGGGNIHSIIKKEGIEIDDIKRKFLA